MDGSDDDPRGRGLIRVIQAYMYTGAANYCASPPHTRRVADGTRTALHAVQLRLKASLLPPYPLAALHALLPCHVKLPA